MLREWGSRGGWASEVERSEAKPSDAGAGFGLGPSLV